MTRKIEPVDYGDFPITKLPPGKAFGADDLTRWSHRRALGRSGMGTEQTRALKLECKHCGATFETIGARRATAKRVRGNFDCRTCGKKGARIVRSQRIKVKSGGR